jgi:antitoxin component YwqK of YwqJK toxin-antitoxin module
MGTVSMSAPTRVDIDTLDVSDGYTHRLNGAPFTGIAYETDLNGRVVAEISIESGIQTGPVREFNEHGQLLLEEHYMGGQKHGSRREWNEAGRLLVEERYEFGILVSRTRWNEAGLALEHYEIGADSEQFGRLQRLRAIMRPDGQ